MAITIGQFLGLRVKNPDTPADPYNPPKESFLELNLPEVFIKPAGPAPLPPPPGVVLTSPAGLPPPPNVALSSPSALPPPPGVVLANPAVLPVPPNVTLSTPAALPPEPAPPPGSPAALPPPPGVVLSAPGLLPAPPVPPQTLPSALPPPPAVPQTPPGLLPPPPAVQQSVRAALPPPVSPIQSVPTALPPAPDFASNANALLPASPEVSNIQSKEPADVNPVATPSTNYKIFGERYSPMPGGDPGSQASDPFLYERQVERTLMLPPGKQALHAMIQVGMFAQNVYGNIWNPALVGPPPIVQNFVRPAIDIPSEGTAGFQIQLGSMVNEAMGEAPQGRQRLVEGEAKPGAHVSLARKKTDLVDMFDGKKDAIANGLSLATAKRITDPLTATAFDNGIIPMRLKGDNDWGFRTFDREDGTQDDDVYVPLSFTDLRPVGTTYRSVYFRPLITSFAESFTPEWNKANYLGRVDPVATYQSTGRTITIGFKLVAFGPEDVRTIYQKLHWLQSMVYPTYDKNLMMTAGPVVRMRVGDVVNGSSSASGKGLPGIIESLDFDYTDALWELKAGYKVPRNIEVSLTFTVIHEVPVGLGNEGMFGGLGSVDDKTGKFTVQTEGEQAKVDSQKFRKFGKGGGEELTYSKLATINQEKKKF